jgi:hypothetical protein
VVSLVRVLYTEPSNYNYQPFRILEHHLLEEIEFFSQRINIYPLISIEFLYFSFFHKETVSSV